MANVDADGPECAARLAPAPGEARPLRWSNVPALVLGILIIPTVLIALFAHGFISEMLRRARRRLRGRRR